MRLIVARTNIVGVKEMSNDTEKEQAVLLSLQEDVKRMKAQRLELKANHF